jgi:hypothetical protein
MGTVSGSTQAVGAMHVRVECYSGHRGEETPRRLFLGRKAVQVVDVVDRWLAPDHRYFKVLGDDGGTYILRHDGRSGQWDMTLFQSRAGRALLDSPLKPRGPSA